MESSSLTLLTVNSEGLITFFEGGRPPWMGQESATIVGQSFADLWRQAPQLNEAIQHIFEEEVTEVEVDGVALDGEGKRHFHRYRLVGIRGDPSTSMSSFVQFALYLHSSSRVQAFLPPTPTPKRLPAS